MKVLSGKNFTNAICTIANYMKLVVVYGELKSKQLFLITYNFKETLQTMTKKKNKN